MLLNLYVIYDKCSGIYSEPFTSVNVDVAKRRFRQICSSSSIVAPDLQLYCVGSFDSSKGILYTTENSQPVFIEGGVFNGSKE